MAGFKFTYWCNKALDAAFGSGDPASWYFQLHTTAPTPGAVTGQADVTRVAIINNASNFPAASSAEKHNGVAIDFGTMSGNKGTVVGISCLDASSGGNGGYYFELATARELRDGDAFSVPVNGMTATEA